ncbi:MAG: RHS repeat-associated core domain-containing protein, partial [Archangium sp.]|nr:RHS repeat-associated core domain-containing protein [Archangium sp.]
EVVEAQSGAKPFDLSLRFPGQYFDPETQKHENWNRYFDPLSGRYLSPEPLLQSPAYVRRMAQSGMSVPTYAYALNNPLKYIDPNGLGALDSMVSAFMWGTGLVWPGAHAGFRMADTYAPWPLPIPYVENHPFMPAGTTTTFGSAICSSGAISASTWKHEEQHLKQAQMFNFIPGMGELYLPEHLFFQGVSALRGGGYDQYNPLETGPYGRQFTGQGHAGDNTAPVRPWEVVAPSLPPRQSYPGLGHLGL